MDIRFSLAGLVVGILVGMTGVGGSSLLAPILVLGFGVPPTIAVGTDLLYGVPTKVYAFVLHARRGNVDWPITRALVAGGIPGALVGLGVFALLRAHVDPKTLQTDVKHVIGIALLIACIAMSALWFVRMRGDSEDRAVAAKPARKPHAPTLTGFGFVVGALVALTSVGSGSVTLPLLAIALPAIGLQRLIGSEIAFAAFLLPVAALGHVTLGDANWGMALALLVGSIPGVWIGNRLCTFVSEPWLRPVVVGVLAIAGSRLL